MCRSEQTTNFTHNLYISAVLQQISPERVCEMSRTSVMPTAKQQPTNDMHFNCKQDKDHIQVNVTRRSVQHRITRNLLTCCTCQQCQKESLQGCSSISTHIHRSSFHRCYKVRVAFQLTINFFHAPTSYRAKFGNLVLKCHLHRSNFNGRFCSIGAEVPFKDQEFPKVNIIQQKTI